MERGRKVGGRRWQDVCPSGVHMKPFNAEPSQSGEELRRQQGEPINHTSDPLLSGYTHILAGLKGLCCLSHNQESLCFDSGAAWCCDDQWPNIVQALCMLPVSPASTSPAKINCGTAPDLKKEVEVREAALGLVKRTRFEEIDEDQALDSGSREAWWSLSAYGHIATPPSPNPTVPNPPTEAGKVVVVALPCEVLLEHQVHTAVSGPGASFSRAQMKEPP
ncbi:unnamed protein product [Pleuronectes platessa]|uniref:Uncharacterized protein n=1 Tax=Pleuronectes platessa TaxID=8262 RepID=A0A9N7V4L5_PLEPL|nr:unnamed protein product [Pleuronectes platessa]